MRADDIREMTDEEIRVRIGELEKERFRLRFQQATMELENPSILKMIRKDIARMKTILHERELAAARAAAEEAAAEEAPAHEAEAEPAADVN